MMDQGAPIRVIAPGRVYRMDMDQTHTPMFHQVEGLAIDRDISMANLKWTLEEFCRAFFEVDKVELRFRASHFPFTEPSAEVDIRYSNVGGQLKIGEGDKWMEILGSGMVHPKVLAAAGVDPTQWQGFAFGMGIDRIAMLKYGIPDLRAFFEADLRWLRHYGFSRWTCRTWRGGFRPEWTIRTFPRASIWRGVTRLSQRGGRRLGDGSLRRWTMCWPRKAMC
jgi:phenylalanyl-tRNA synthetase alpha chain